MFAVGTPRNYGMREICGEPAFDARRRDGLGDLGRHNAEVGYSSELDSSEKSTRPLNRDGRAESTAGRLRDSFVRQTQFPLHSGSPMRDCRMFAFQRAQRNNYPDFVRVRIRDTRRGM